MKTMYLTLFAVSALALSASAQTTCPSGTITQLQRLITPATPCTPGGGITVYGPISLTASAEGKSPIGTDDVTLQFSYAATNPPTISVTTLCAKCVSTGAAAAQIQVGFYMLGTIQNFGAALFDHGYAQIHPAGVNACMAESRVDATAGAGTGVGVFNAHAAYGYQFTHPVDYVPGLYTFAGQPQPIYWTLLENSWNCSYSTTKEAILYLSQVAQ